MNQPTTKITTLIEDNKLLLTTTFKACGVEPGLQNLIFEGTAEVLKSLNIPLKKLMYMAGLQNDLLLLCKNAKSNRIDLVLEEHLYVMNFNTIDHFNYCKMKIMKELSELYDESEKYLVLCEYKRRFSAKQAYKNLSFEKNIRGIRDLMLSFLNSEIKCIKKTLFAKNRENSGNVQNEGLPNSEVIALVSVDVLAYLLFLLVKCGVFPEDAKTALMRMVARYFKTPGVGPEGISLNSLHVKYRQAVQATAKKVKTLLLKMVKQIDDDFGLN